MRPLTAASWLPRIVVFAISRTEIGALVRRAAVADGVAQAVVDVDLLVAVRLEHGAQRLVVRVDVAEDPEAH